MYIVTKLGNVYLSDVLIESDNADFIKWRKNGGVLRQVESVDAEIRERETKRISDNEYQLYVLRKSDGESAYLKLSAEFRLAKLSGQITEETHSYLEELLTPVRNEVMFGQWKKGLSILESIGNTQIGVELYERLHSQISSYVLENY